MVFATLKQNSSFKSEYSIILEIDGNKMWHLDDISEDWDYTEYFSNIYLILTGWLQSIERQLVCSKGCVCVNLIPTCHEEDATVILIWQERKLRHREQMA